MLTNCCTVNVSYVLYKKLCFIKILRFHTSNCLFFYFQKFCHDLYMFAETLVTILPKDSRLASRVQDYLDSETRYRNDVIVSLRFG